ncbi:MAG: beta-lactamase family protein [bacterium]|nr:beta-lactamase family protein [bacterium]
MRTFFCAFWLGVLLLHFPLRAQEGRQPDRQITEGQLDELGASAMPGVAYAIVEQGAVREIGVTGVKRLGSEAPIDPDTPFLIGSISKSFTAIAVLQLAEAGQLGLDDPITRHLPAFADERSGAITIRQLLAHTSGYSTYQGNVSQAGEPPGKGPIAHRADRLAATAPDYEPGTAWAYSNANYSILGRLIEVVSGQTYPAYVRSKILEPAAMVHSFVSDGERHAAMATGHRPWFGSKRGLADNRTDLGIAPQGGIVASASDLARYMVLMMNGEDDIIRAETKAAMMSPASEASPFYGLGWFVDRDDGTVWHSGVSPGVETLMTLMPAAKKGVVVLVNAGSGVGFGETTGLLDGITASALGLDYTGEGSRLSQQATFLGIVLLPIAFLLSMVWAWRHRAVIRAKSRRPAGRFSLWFPLLATLGTAWSVTDLVPRLMGAPLDTLCRFQPDLGLAMIATAVTSVLWAVFRLGVAYTGRAGGE